MNTNLSFAGTTCPKRMAGHLRTACATWLLLLLTLPAVVQAQFQYTTNNGTITILKYNGSGEEVTVPDTINGMPVANIGPAAFHHISLTSVIIPNSVISIGQSAFFGCTSLTNVGVGTRL